LHEAATLLSLGAEGSLALDVRTIGAAPTVGRGARSRMRCSRTSVGTLNPTISVWRSDRLSPFARAALSPRGQAGGRVAWAARDRDLHHRQPSERSGPPVHIRRRAHRG